MSDIDWNALIDRIERGLTTGDDADAVRDLLEKYTDLETELSKFGDELFDAEE